MKAALSALLVAAAHAKSVLLTLEPTQASVSAASAHAQLEDASKNCNSFEVLRASDDAPLRVIVDADLEHVLPEGYRVVEREESRPFSEINPPSGYSTPAELMSQAEELEQRFPGLAKVIDVTEEWNGPNTVEGRHIYAIKVSDNVHVDEAEPNSLVVSAHHCRELITPELALDTAARLLEGYASGSTRDIVDNNQVYIIWSMNPDGADYVWSTNNMWRKNRRQNSGGSYGIDLNRNYPMGWDYSCAGSSVQNSCTYRGTGSLSEAETQVMDLFQSERKFARVVDFHSYAREVRVIYADNCRNCADLPDSLDDYVKRVGLDYAAPMNYRQVRSCCTGGNVHTAYKERGSLGFLVETGTAFQPSADVMRQELVRVWPGTKWILEWPLALTGSVTDDVTGQAIPSATFSSDALQFTEGEVGGSTNTQGVYHFWLPEGIHEVTVDAPGYASQNTTVHVSHGETSVINWAL